MKSIYETPKATSNVSLGNLYDVNKQLMDSMPSIAEDILNTRLETLTNWISDRADQHYFMLLCNEEKDYTLFNIQPNSLNHICINQIETMAKDVIECMTNRGVLQALELQDDGAWELWVKKPEGCFAYYLFPYGDAVLEY